MFDFLGLQHQDQAAYELWLRHPTWDVEAVARELGTDCDEARACRERLRAKGLVTADPAEPDTVLPVGPDAVVDRFIAEIEARAARERAEALRARAQLSALVAAHLVERGEPCNGDVERIAGASAAELRLQELARAAETEILTLHAGAAPHHDVAGSCFPLDCRAQRRGVTLRAIYRHEAVARPEVARDVQVAVASGAQVRTIDRLPVWARIIDGTVAALPVDEDPDGGVLVVRGTGMVSALVALFERYWSLAQPLARRAGAGASPHGCEDGGLTVQQRELLYLLSLGVKDEAAARQMGLSVRTVRRLVSVLCQRLGASSRFQAGVQAVHRGWL